MLIGTVTPELLNEKIEVLLKVGFWLLGATIALTVSMFVWALVKWNVLSGIRETNKKLVDLITGNNKAGVVETQHLSNQVDQVPKKVVQEIKKEGASESGILSKGGLAHG